MSAEHQHPTFSNPTLHKVVNMIGVVVPAAAFFAVVALAWGHWLTVVDAEVFAIMFLWTGFGVTIGLHRLLTHRSFKTYPAVRYFWALAGAMALEGPLVHWVANHRKHHSHSDHDGDPHSPHGHGDGVVGALKGLWHAHVGWILRGADAADEEKFAADLLRDRGIKLINRHYLLIALMSLVIMPGLLGLVLGGPGSVLSAILWGGILRVFWLHHVTFSINSICHFFGSRRFRTRDESRNVFWLAPLTFGESWHHNHHAFPASAYHGLRWYEFDPSALLIRAMKATGLAWDVVVPSRERQRKRLLVADER